MVDEKTEKFIQRMVRENFTPENLSPGLKVLEAKLEGAEGKQRMVIEAFVDGIKMVLGKVS